MSEHSAEQDAPVCPACGHPHPGNDCGCGCEYDTAFCGQCGWLDCECDEEASDA